MEDINVVNYPKGIFSCEISVSVDEWKSILTNPAITTQNYKEALIAFYREEGHKATCKELSLKYYGNAIDAQKFNSWITNFGKAVVKHLGRFRIIDEDGKERYWPVPMNPGRSLDNGLFEWTLRKELVIAMESLGWEGKLTWVPFYIEFADKLLQFKDDRRKLLDIVYSLDKKFVGYIKSVDGGHVSDIDPFTVFGIFNRGITNENRIKLCNYFKEKLDLKSNVPTDFDGVPVVNNMMATFYWRENESTDIQPLWNLFVATLKNDLNDVESTFDIVCRQQGIKWNITMGLYWIRPYDFISLDSCNRTYLPRLGFEVFKENKISSSNYLSLLKQIKESIKEKSIEEESIPEISYSAWVNTYGSSERFWLLGYCFGVNNSQFDRFIDNSIWEGLFDESKDVDKRQLNMVRNIKVGDYILIKSTATKGTNHDLPFMRVKAVGIVTEELKESDINGVKSCTFGIKYLSTDIKDFDGKKYGSYRQTIHEATDKIQEVIDYAKSFSNLSEEDIDMNTNRYQEYINLLKETKNLVLTGAPGTGKTFMAQTIAKEMGAETEFVQFHPSYDYTDFVEGLRPVEKEGGQMGFERKDGVFKEFCKRAIKNLEDSQKTRQELSAEKSLEEKYNEVIDKIENGIIDRFKLKTEGKFMEIVKVSDNNNIILCTPDTTTNRTYTVSFERLAKLSKAFPDSESLNNINNINDAIRNIIGGCNASSYWAVLYEVYKQETTTQFEIISDVKKINFLFIIDEINRGELSKIFGELFYAIDPGYRGKKGRVKTQYQNLVDDDDLFAEGFYVPENVYILATMNDIDRSVESMDFAMRRRFTWQEITPDDTESMLDSLSCAEEAKATMKRLNAVIADTDGLGDAFMIGPSYFLKLENNGGNFEKLWRMNIEPLLKEYLRGFRKSKDILKKFEKAYFSNEEPVVDGSIEELGD